MKKKSAHVSGGTCPAILAEKESSLDAFLALQEYCVALQHSLHFQEMYHIAEMGGLFAQQGSGSLHDAKTSRKFSGAPSSGVFAGTAVETAAHPDFGGRMRGRATRFALFHERLRQSNEHRQHSEK